ncbi:hypothetical protein FACS1894182_12260 [Bacteroidia bacterium]|nr:hypothetical protein FACS1894182_12260 [Bacteroidia bacterium]
MCLFSCQHNKKQEVKVQDDWLSKLDKQKEFLYDRSIPSISIILSDTVFTGQCVLLIYDEMDCDDCVKKGFNLIHRLDSLTIPNTFIITTSNPGRSQLLYDYPKYVFVDRQDLIRKDLKYVTTPVLLVLSEENQIRQVLFPGIATQREEEEFVDNCLKL